MLVRAPTRGIHARTKPRREEERGNALRVRAEGSTTLRLPTPVALCTGVAKGAGSHDSARGGVSCSESLVVESRFIRFRLCLHARTQTRANYQHFLIRAAKELPGVENGCKGGGLVVATVLPGLEQA